MTKVPSIARLKVTLDDVEPAVLRRLEVPLDLRLDRLHLVLQAALGWTNSHLWEFRARDVGWGIPDPEWDARSGPLDARKTTLLRVLEDTGTKTLTYLYDFGDGWEHTIKIERIAAAHPGLTYPVLLEAVGRCPPEDVGGPLATRSSWRRSPTPSTKPMPRCSNGARAALTPMRSIPSRSSRRSKRPHDAGPASRRSKALTNYPSRSSPAFNYP